MRQLVSVTVLGLLLTACGTSTPTTTEAVTTDSGNGDLAAMRELAFAYWEAFNNYQPDEVLALLEPGYRAERDETIRSEIDRVKTFGVTLGASEESPPHLTAVDEGEMLIALKEPLGTRSIAMRFARIEGQWMITFAEEQ
jgi:hypothetical protein